MFNQMTITPMSGSQFQKAFWANMLWVNISGLPRYFLVIKPMLHSALPTLAGVAPVSLPILASWGVWTLGFVLATTGFYWMYFERNGRGISQVVRAGLWATVATIGLTWLGISNMGLLPLTFFFVAMAWATIEQIVSASIVARFLGSGAATT